ncbi:hypothetical protein F4778DRAFT_784547 [Xylariomycetidae sp. FL2044]|nr:hypothetical protein F4778DRAFT_784547 [Xylariomycetidae sp. FL2044]
MAQTTIHQGPYESIPSTASPGLLFLKELLPVLDSLEPDQAALRSLLSPDATFTSNAHPTNSLNTVLPLFARRGEKVARFHHEVSYAWDIAAEPGGSTTAGARTVLYESVSTTVFKGDPDANEAKVKEFNIVELAPKKAGGPLHAVALRTIMDASPVTKLAQALIASKAQAAA